MEKGFARSRHIKKSLLWLKTRNKLILASVAIIFFCTMLVLIIVETCYISTVELEASPSVELEYKTTIPDLDNFKGDTSSTCVANSGTITCTLSFDVNSINALSLSGDIDLVLENVVFTNNTISNGWLKGLSNDVQTLTISPQQLLDLGELAFSGTPFDRLNTLIIKNSRIKYLRNHSFKNLPFITTFEISCSNVFMNVEFNALEGMSDLINTLHFSECLKDPEAIKNLTGTGLTKFNNLLSLTLSYNYFKKVLDKSFVDTPNLVSLYLTSNSLQTLEVDAFEGIGRSLEKLIISNSSLETLPDGIFRKFTLSKEHSGWIGIEGNRWRCDCDLAWLKKFYINNLDRYFQNGSISFTCEPDQLDYTLVDFCPDSPTSDTTTTEIPPSATTDADTPTTATNIASTKTSITTSITTSTTASTTTSQPSTNAPDDFLYLNCTNLTEYRDTLEGLNRVYSHTIQVRNGTITYNFYQIQNTPNFEIKVLNSVGNDYLIWINSKNSSDYGCVTDIKETVVLYDLQYGMTYTICLLKESADMVTPFDCTSLTVPVEWENTAWITNKHMPIVIGGVLGVTLVIIIATSVIIFYTIRQNPKLIKGNKRVVIVRNKSADALVMPNYEKQQYIPPSIYTNSEGYLTPRHKMYEKINERRFRPLNTITEKFYQDFHHGTTSRQSRSNYTGFVHRRSVGSEVYEPPPLPPNHPSERPCSSRQSTLYGN